MKEKQQKKSIHYETLGVFNLNNYKLGIQMNNKEKYIKESIMK